jgi:hypothetical protein
MVMSAIVLIERVDGILIILHKTTKVYGTNSNRFSSATSLLGGSNSSANMTTDRLIAIEGGWISHASGVSLMCPGCPGRPVV